LPTIVEIIPKAFVAGLFLPPNIGPSGDRVTREQLDQIWAEVGPAWGYRSFALGPDQQSAQILGSSDEDLVLIQPPIVQVRDLIPQTAHLSADKAEQIFKAVANRLGAAECWNLGIRHVYHVPVPDNDARAFVLHRILSKTDQDFSEIRGAADMWAGVKYQMLHQDGQRDTLVIEPFVKDMRFLFIDLDSQFPGPVDLDRVKDRARDAETYLSSAVKRYLQGLVP
jgi:hypothetical protein